MANLVETIDIQRAIRAAAYKKAHQLYSGKNLARGWNQKPTTNQIRGVFRIAYSQLQKNHPRMRWLQFRYKPPWISKLDYYAARGGIPIMKELLEIVKNIGDRPLEITAERVRRLPPVIQPEPPASSYENDQAITRAIEFMGGLSR